MEDRLREALAVGEAQGMRYVLDPPRIAPVGVAGSQLGHRPGSSIEFMDHREYQPGDDVRRIDWAGYARSDRLVVKLYREEVSPHLDLTLDLSRSMNLPESRKAEAALALAATLSTAAVNASFTTALWTAGDGFTRKGRSSERPGAWGDIAFEYDQPMERSYARMPPSWRRQGVRVVVSDLLWAGDPLPVVKRLAEGASSLVMLQVLAKQDAAPPERGNLRLYDSESGQLLELFIDAAAERRYKQAFTRHQESWRVACHQVGATLVTVVAEDLLDDWDLRELIAHRVLRVK